jgi:beta-lactamase superfamily II metal-dependent hydrolase
MLKESAKFADSTKGAEVGSPPVHTAGNLTVWCLDVGQGDCTLIKTPGGKHIMIDCGSLSSTSDIDPKTIRDAVRSFFTAARIDILIQTHPDEDHHNRILEVLKPRGGQAAFAVGLALFSVSPDRALVNGLEGSHMDKTQAQRGKMQRGKILYAYCRPAASSSQGTSVSREFGVRADPRGELLDTAALQKDFPGVRPDGDNKLIGILDEPGCQISILVSNVVTYTKFVKDARVGDIAMAHGDSAKGANTGSIVTLVNAHNKKLLFCGDATLVTEAVLVEWHKTRIANLDFLRVAHHGSGVTSSRPSFVDAVTPKVAVISSARSKSEFLHPRWSAVRRYAGNYQTADLLSQAHDFGFWNEDAESKFLEKIQLHNRLGDAIKEAKNQAFVFGNSSGTYYWYGSKLPMYDTPHTYIVPKPGG